MSAHVTERDLQTFASLGFPTSVRANGNADTDSLVESVLHVMTAPSARLAQAAAMALHALALSGELNEFLQYELSDEVRRRLGYLMEYLSQNTAPTESESLKRVARQLYRPDDSKKSPVTFMARTTPTLLRLQRKRADEVNHRWSVYGNVNLDDYLE